MADKTFYAWTNLEVPDADEPSNPRKITRYAPGDTVTASDLGIDDDEFQSLADAGAIRQYEYPEMGNFGGSPVELAKAKLAAQAEGGYFDTQYGTVGTDKAPEVDPETAKPIEPGTNAPSAPGTPTPAKVGD